MNGIDSIGVFATTIVNFSNGTQACSCVDDACFINRDDRNDWPNLRLADENKAYANSHSDIDLDASLVAYWIDKHHKQWFFTSQDEEFLQDAATMFPNRIYFVLVPANI